MKRDFSSLCVFDSVYEILFRVYGCRVVIFIDHPSSGHALTRGLLFSVSKGRARGWNRHNRSGESFCNVKSVLHVFVRCVDG